MKQLAAGFSCLFCLSLWGCATSTSTLQSARTLRQGEVQLTVAASVPVATVVVGELIDSAELAYDRLKSAEDASRPVTESELRQSLEAATALVLFSPSLFWEVVGRVGIVDRFDAGLRISHSLVKAEAKFQFLRIKDSVDASVFVGYAYHFGVGPSMAESFYSIFDYVQLGDYSRHDLDVGVLFGREWGRWLSLYGGPRYMVSFVAIDPDISKISTEAGLPETQISSQIHHAGAVGGLMIGYKYVYLQAELTLLWAVFEPKILGERMDLGGMVISPTLGITARF